MKNIEIALGYIGVDSTSSKEEIEGEINSLSFGADQFEDDESFWSAVALGYLLAKAEQK